MDINLILDKLQLNTRLDIKDIPDIDLYMDQVIQLFEKKFSPTKRNEEEKVLTKTMINNYAKGKLFFPIKNKKYSRDHIMLISMIYQMKGALSIHDVKQTLETLNNKIMEEDFDLLTLYMSYLTLFDQNLDIFNSGVKNHMNDIHVEIEKLGSKDETYLEKLLLITTFTEMSNFYRKAAEKMVDNMLEEATKRKQ
ncbi:hypothetical protein OPHB3_2510 [Oceanobacillus picturae]|uniref:Cytoplasmic protein n=1 Tax=Oceanobacillus picturae TaxID=171693 RepID=W9B9J6_9BACI|nr:DUF1836 domain-containing protein [Oceanobacillus picturae]RIU94577.1 DUF1836 domain-containing protein [Oceanobacillus picturae]GAQ18569.1 hypothetical protein OPHB3_2510 [Oceanobacillus picturae]CDO03180.1 hypothetical protein BN988_01683 [Oceanobacillus picturae]